MSGEQPRQGMLDTNIVILRRWIDPAELPDEMAISAITLAELSAGPHEVRSNDEQDAYDERAERARRLEILQRAESEFEPVPFDAEAARIFGSLTAAIIAAGRKPRGRVVDLMIAATAIAEGLPLYTTNPADFAGLDRLARIIPVARPPVPRERPLSDRRGAWARVPSGGCWPGRARLAQIVASRAWFDRAISRYIKPVNGPPTQATTKNAVHKPAMASAARATP